jgi:hypothetical protein
MYITPLQRRSIPIKPWNELQQKYKQWMSGTIRDRFESCLLRWGQ